MAGGLFSKWSCQVLEGRSQRQTGLIPTGEDCLSRCDWQDTRFGEKLLGQLQTVYETIYLALHSTLSLAVNSVC